MLHNSIYDTTSSVYLDHFAPYIYRSLNSRVHNYVDGNKSMARNALLLKFQSMRVTYDLLLRAV